MIRRRSPRSLQGATVVVTGASSGVGAQMAEVLAGQGAGLVLSARSPEPLEAVAARCRSAGAPTLVVPADVTREADCATLIRCAVERFDGIDILLCCAGLGMWARFGDLADDEVLRRVMDVNYWGVVGPALHALPHLRRRGGMLAVVSSIQGSVGVPYHSGYAAAKHAVQGFCDSLRMEERAHGVEVLTVLAHWIRGTGLRERALGSNGRPRGDTAPAHGDDAVPVEILAAEILRAIRRRRRRIHVPSRMRLLGLLAECMPQVADRLISRRVEREDS